MKISLFKRVMYKKDKDITPHMPIKPIIKEKAKMFELTAEERMTAAIAGAFALVIALTWNDFITDGVSQLIQLFGIGHDQWIFRLITAVVTTLICILGITIVSRKRK